LSYSNPTPIRIGMTGSISGKQYRVVGRVVLGEEEGGGTYYWNEFNLESDGGEVATLVYEQTERGGEWRLFHLFEPAGPMTAAEAATKREGDPLDLEGMHMFVRLVSKSRVYHIEGKAPEGVKVGDEARYFNAVSGNNMIVVSWTGAEVEFYRGLDLSPTTVSAAFNVRIVDFSRLFPAPGGNRWSSWLAVGPAAALVFVCILVVGYHSFKPNRRLPAIVRTGAPASPLVIGKAGSLGGTPFQIQSHLLVELAMVGRKFYRHEYLLSDDQGAKALLVRGSKPGAADWWLFKPLQPQTPLSPQQAAAVRWGQTVDIGGLAARVTDLFQATIRQVESAEASELSAGDVFFGFAGPAQDARLLVRWNANYINFFQGVAVQEREVMAAFGKQQRK
jgi:Domain of unknown function (DUF4178)